MRLRLVALVGLTLLTLFALERMARAQDFANALWVPLERGGQVITDPAGDASPGWIDLVGDAQDPVVYVASDPTWLYVRIRVADSPIKHKGDLKPFGWGCEIDTNGDPSTYELLVMLDGIRSVVRLEENTITVTPNSPSDPPEVTLQVYPVPTYGEGIEAGTSLGGGGDWFVDAAVRRDDLVPVGVTAVTPIRFFCGAAPNAKLPSKDAQGGGNADTLTDAISVPYLCGDHSCVPCNSDRQCGATCEDCTLNQLGCLVVEDRCGHKNHDAGVAHDAGVSMDAALPRDGGVRKDGGAATDGGRGTDLGLNNDGGSVTWDMSMGMPPLADLSMGMPPPRMDLTMGMSPPAVDLTMGMSPPRMDLTMGMWPPAMDLAMGPWPQADLTMMAGSVDLSLGGGGRDLSTNAGGPDLGINMASPDLSLGQSNSDLGGGMGCCDLAAYPAPPDLFHHIALDGHAQDGGALGQTDGGGALGDGGEAGSGDGGGWLCDRCLRGDSGASDDAGGVAVAGDGGTIAGDGGNGKPSADGSVPLGGADAAGQRGDGGDLLAYRVAGGGCDCSVGPRRAGAGSGAAFWWLGMLVFVRRFARRAHLLRSRKSSARLLGIIVVALAGAPLESRALADGFQLNRFEPTPAGEWFFTVQSPWYSSTRWFAGGVTFNYAHNPLVLGTVGPAGQFDRTGSVIEHQLTGHLDLAGSFLDRIQLHASLPVVLLERGAGFAGFGPLENASVGDLRLGAMIRLYGQPERDHLSISLGANVWVPIGVSGAHAGDENARGLPRVVFAGMAHPRLRWAFNYGFLIRPVAHLSAQLPAVGSTVGSEMQLGIALAYVDPTRRLHLGPELNLATTLNDAHGFNRDFTSVELLVGLRYLFVEQLLLGVASGAGILRQPGTPDLRVLATIAWAPRRPLDRDGDKIPDARDACPNQPGPATGDAATNGCPDRDHDSVIDARDLCPEVARGEHPDPDKPGCPDGDRDGDKVVDHADFCPDEPSGEKPDPARRGCPMHDRDRDGVVDGEDRCPDEPTGAHPDPAKLGCPDSDSDQDGVYDHEDLCPHVPFGIYPDPDRLGCPLPDRDLDTVADDMDACPDVAGMPHTDPAKNGCPGLVIIKDHRLVILSPVFFATDKDEILAKSFPVLTAVADVLIARGDLRHVGIEGHTDNRGSEPHNLELSERRAQSVRRWLMANGIAADRLDAHGFGSARPIETNATINGRAVNRRVEFILRDLPEQGAP